MNKPDTVYKITTLPSDRRGTKKVPLRHAPDDARERAATIRRPNYALRKAAAGLALTGALAGTVTGGLIGWSKANVAWDRHERAGHNTSAFEHVKARAAGTFILKSGVNVRYSPSIDGDNHNNLYKSVPAGKVLSVTQPLLYRNGGDTWLGFIADGNNPNSPHGRAVHTVWADATALAVQDKMEHFPGLDDDGKPLAHQSVPITIEPSGAIATAGQVDPYAATATMLSQAALRHFEETHPR